MSVTATLTSPASAHFKVFTCTVPRPTLIPPDYLNEATQALLPLVRAEVRKQHMKCQLILAVELMKKDKGELAIFETFHLRDTPQELLNVYEVFRELMRQSKVILERFDKILTMSSGWTFSRIVSCECRLHPYKHAVGGDYVPTPNRLHATKAIINCDNSELHQGLCFYICLMMSEQPAGTKNMQKANFFTKFFKNDPRLKDVRPFVGINDIPALEVLFNKTISVFKPNDRPDESLVEQVYRTKNPGLPYVDLLLLEDNNGDNHFAWITKVNKLFYTTTKHKEAKFMCRNCSMLYNSEEAMKQHFERCLQEETKFIKYPEQSTYKQFDSFYKQLPVPYSLVFDFESALPKLPEPHVEEGKPVPLTKRLTRHSPISYCLYRMCYIPEADHHIPIIRRADTEEELMQMFACDVIEQKVWIENKLENCVPMKLTREEEDSFKAHIKVNGPCHICGDPIGKKKAGSTDDKKKDLDLDRRGVRDHCHVTGKYRGPAHQSCNWRFSYVKVLTSEMTVATPEIPARHKYLPLIPIFAHNTKGYDGHLILKNFSKVFIGMNLSCIPNNMQKFMAFSFDNLRFLDSWQFLMSPLDTCVKTLVTPDKSKFFHTNRYYANNTPEQKALAYQKGDYPYEWVDNYNKLNEPALPAQEEWFSKLKDENISDADFNRAHLVWETFGMKTFADYHDFYLVNDVLQLADVMTVFRQTSQEMYGLDPLHYYTTPGLSGDSLYKTTKGKVEIFGGQGAAEKYKFFESASRGGICGPSKRKAVANNPHCPWYDPSKPTAHIIYIDANSLYAWAMTQPMPVDGFEFINENDIELTRMFTPEHIMSIPDHAPIGYHLEVTLEYPEAIHELHNDYPLGSEIITPPGTASKSKKLISSLNTKKYFTCHYRYLKTMIRYKLKLVKVHRVIKYNQSPWMSPFINMNNKARSESIKTSDDFGKTFFKLMNNASYGKQLENKRKHVNVKLVSTHQDAIKCYSSPQFKGVTCNYTDDLTAIEMDKASIKLDNPIYLGQSILDISKVHMAEFHYGHMKKKYGAKAQLLYTDTDSLIYEVETEDIRADMLADQHHFDLSNQKYKDKDDNWVYNSYYSTNNENKVGPFKDETPNAHIIEAVFLRPKMYALRIVNAKGIIIDKKVVKGVRKPAIQRMKFDDFEEQRMRGSEGKPQYATNVSIRSYDHELFTQEVTKISLSANDDKRVILEDNIHTRAYGHYLN